MNPSSTLSSRIRTVIFSILFNALLSSATQLPSYADHCNSLVPESSKTKYERAYFPYFPFRAGYCNGGNKILSEGSNSFIFQVEHSYRTEQDGVISVAGLLVFLSQSYKSLTIFRLKGLWSGSSGNLCMVGDAYVNVKNGKILLQAVLKLRNLKNSTSTITTLVTGTMESLSSSDDLSYFEPISIMILPRLNYKYTLFSKGDEFSGGDDVVKGLPISSLPSESFCSLISGEVYEFNLIYTGDCDSSKTCGPFGANIGNLPTAVSFEQIQCLEMEKRIRVLVDFPSRGYDESNQTFKSNLHSKLVGEGWWDDKINQLWIVACRFLNTTDSLSNAQVGDCSTSLRLGFLAIWSIRDTRNVVGKIWSTKSVNDSGYFDEIMFQSSWSPFRTFSGWQHVED